MKIKDIVAPLEAFAPLAWAEDFDNSGLIVGRAEDEVQGAVVCVDVTHEVLDEAEKLGAGLVISHHPPVFHPLRRFRGEGHTQQIVERVIRSGTALYACHTNLDNAPEGLSHRLARIVGLDNVAVLEPAAHHSESGSEVAAAVGTGVVGNLAESVEPLEFLREVQRLLDVKVVRYSDILSGKIRRVAICSGSGAPFIEAAKRADAEVYLAADFKYHDFADLGGATGSRNRDHDAGLTGRSDQNRTFIIADIGHFESEFCAIDLIYEVISKKIANFAFHKSANSRNPVGYLVSDPRPAK